MPMTIGIDQVPRNIVRPKWYEDLGYAQGALARAILMQQMTGGGGVGRVTTTPTPGNPGQLTFPSGATTRTSPLEMQQIQAMGGVPNSQGGMTPMGQPGQGGVSYQVPTRLWIRPNLDYQVKQADLDYKRAQTQSMTPEFQANLLRRAQGLPPLGDTSSGITPAHIQQIEDDALAGDEDAAAAYRYLKKIGSL